MSSRLSNAGYYYTGGPHPPENGTCSACRSAGLVRAMGIGDRKVLRGKHSIALCAECFRDVLGAIRVIEERFRDV